MSETYFPILVWLVDDLKWKVCKNVEDIPSGKAIVVYETNTKIKE